MEGTLILWLMQVSCFNLSVSVYDRHQFTIYIFLTIHPRRSWITRITANPVKHRKIVYCSVNSTTCFGLRGQNEVDQEYKAMYTALWKQVAYCKEPGSQFPHSCVYSLVFLANLLVSSQVELTLE